MQKTRLFENLIAKSPEFELQKILNFWIHNLQISLENHPESELQKNVLAEFTAIFNWKSNFFKFQTVTEICWCICSAFPWTVYLLFLAYFVQK